MTRAVLVKNLHRFANTIVTLASMRDLAALRGNAPAVELANEQIEVALAMYAGAASDLREADGIAPS